MSATKGDSGSAIETVELSSEIVMVRIKDLIGCWYPRIEVIL
jgi:hypothetical protein